MSRLTSPLPISNPVIVDAPARLHLGFLDPSGSLGRRFASLGLVIDGLPTTLEACLARRNEVVVGTGIGAVVQARLERYLATLQRATGADQPLRVMLHRAPPAHAGFGSGTQFALALGRAFSSCHGLELELDARRIAALLGRGERSGIGIAGFDLGGLLVDGGPAPAGAPAPLLSRMAFPAAWRVLLVMDESVHGLSGPAERVAMETLAPFPRERAAVLCHELLLRVLPAAAEQDFAPFAAGVTAIQRAVGEYFAPAQGGSMYTSAAVGRLLEWLAAHYRAGIGQSSWGPTGFAILPSAQAAAQAIGMAREAGVVAPQLRLLVTTGRNRGALTRSGADLATGTLPHAAGRVH